MAFGLYSLLEAALLVINAMCVLHEERFLAKVSCEDNKEMQCCCCVTRCCNANGCCIINFLNKLSRQAGYLSMSGTLKETDVFIFYSHVSGGMVCKF